MPNIHKKYYLEVTILLAVYVAILFLSFIGKGEFVFSDSFNMKDGSIYWAMAIRTLMVAIIFFSCVYWLIPKYLTQRKYISLLIFSTLIVALVTFAEHFIDLQLEKIYDLPENLTVLFQKGERFNRRDITGPTILMNSFVLIAAYGYRFAKDWMANETIKRKLTEEKLTSELRFLKSQINPHLLFNTLNGIFSLARKNKDFEVAEAIQKLSEIMRFMLYDNTASRIELKQELQLIQHFIELQKLRFTEYEIVVSLHTDGELGTVNLAPMLLIPFVENAFKYGIDNKGDSLIKISLSVEGGHRLTFHITNNVYKTDTLLDPDSGIGLTNVKRRLELLYPERHTLSISSTQTTFEVILILNL